MKKLITIILLFFIFQPITNAINIEVSPEVLDMTNLKFISSTQNLGIDIDYGKEIELKNTFNTFQLENLKSNDYKIDFSGKNEVYNYFLEKLGKKKLNYFINNKIIYPINNPAKYLHFKKEEDSQKYDKIISNKIYQFYSDKEIKNYKIRIYLKPLKNYYWNTISKDSNLNTKIYYFNEESLPQDLELYSKSDNKITKMDNGYILQKIKYTNNSGREAFITEMVPYIDYLIDINKGNNLFNINYKNFIYNSCEYSHNDNCNSFYFFGE